MSEHKSVIRISLVLYKPNESELFTTINKLLLSFSSKFDVELVVVDNSPLDCEGDIESKITNLLADNCIGDKVRVEFVFFKNSLNLGFGMAHNQAITHVNNNIYDCKYHLILNPDLEVAPDALQNALEFMNMHPECGLLTPYATWKDGQVQHLCKRYPTVFELLVRGFAPTFFKNIFRKKLNYYEMADVLSEDNIFWDPLIVSGCFMLFRTDVLRQLGGFDPRFFLYFEDFDISLRAGKISRIAYVPQVKVVHHGGHASRKGWKHIKMFGRSMITFFNIHGWRWW